MAHYDSFRDIEGTRAARLLNEEIDRREKERAKGEKEKLKGVKLDRGKPDWTLLPWGAVEQVVRVLDHGVEKYSREGWRKVEGARLRYSAAALRHITTRLRGERLDPETGLPHLAHAVCCLLFLLEMFDDD